MNTDVQNKAMNNSIENPNLDFINTLNLVCLITFYDMIFLNQSSELHSDNHDLKILPRPLSIISVVIITMCERANYILEKGRERVNRKTHGHSFYKPSGRLLWGMFSKSTVQIFQCV